MCKICHRQVSDSVVKHIICQNLRASHGELTHEQLRDLLPGVKSGQIVRVFRDDILPYRKQIFGVRV